VLQPRCPHEIWPWIKPTSNRTFFSCWERAMTVKKCGERSREGVQRVGLWLREQTKAAFSHDAWSCSQKRGGTPESTCENHHSHYWFGWFLLQCPNVNAPFLDSAWLTWVHWASSRLTRHTLGPGLLFTFTIRNPSIFWGVKNNDDNIPMASL
jgi:hypothetical protein